MNTTEWKIGKLEELIKLTKELIKVYVTLRDETKLSKPSESLGYATNILNNQLALKFFIEEKKKLEQQ